MPAAPLPKNASLAPIQLRQPLGCGDVVHGVGVKKWVERLRRPRYRREPVAGRPAINLAHVFHDQRVAKFLT